MHPQVPREYVEAVDKPLDKELEGLSIDEIKAFLQGVQFASCATANLSSQGFKQVALGLLATIEALQVRIAAN